MSTFVLLSAYTIRFCEKIGVLPHVQRTETGVRQFPQRDVDYLRALSELKKLGLSLETIADIKEEGCLFDMEPQDPRFAEAVARRIDLLQEYQRKFFAQRRALDEMLALLEQSVHYY